MVFDTKRKTFEGFTPVGGSTLSNIGLQRHGTGEGAGFHGTRTEKKGEREKGKGKKGERAITATQTKVVQST
jgi:hypothetical protein